MATQMIPARPSLLDELSLADLPTQLVELVRWLIRWALDAVVALLTRPAAGRHSGSQIGDHVGVSDESVEELTAIREAMTDTTEIPVVEDVTETGFEPIQGDLAATAEFTWLDRLDADRTYQHTMRAAGEWPPDATEIALTGGARALDGGVA